MADLDKAVEFVRGRGGPADLARLAYTLDGAAPAPAVVDALLAGQWPDGGWAPFWAPDSAGLDATCYRLAQADQLGMGAADSRIAAALRFLAGRQRPDGSWEEDATLADRAPPWAQPGDLAARLYLTANCGYWMVVLGPGVAPAAQAGDALAPYLASDGHLPTFPHGQWLAGALWFAAGRRDLAARVLAYLSTRLATLPPAGNLSWLIVALHRAGVPAAHPLLQRATPALAAAQQPDGRWVSEDGPKFDLHVTLEAIRALRLCGWA